MTDDRQTDHATEKCVAIGGIGYARAIPLNNITNCVSPMACSVNNQRLYLLLGLQTSYHVRGVYRRDELAIFFNSQLQLRLEVHHFDLRWTFVQLVVDLLLAFDLLWICCAANCTTHRTDRVEAKPRTLLRLAANLFLSLLHSVLYNRSTTDRSRRSLSVYANNLARTVKAPSRMQ